MVGCRADVGCFASLWIVLIQCTAAAECDAAAVGDQEVAVCVCIDSGRIIIGRKVFAQRLEVIRTNISNNQTVFALNGRTNINLAILNMNDGNTVLVVIFCIGQSSCHVFCPGRPLDGIFEESQVIVALNGFPSVTTVFTHNQGRVAGSNVTAAVDNVRVVWVNCNRFPELSAFAVAVNLNQVSDINAVKGFTAIPRTENFGFCIAEICTAAEQVDGVIIRRVNAHRIYAQESTFGVVQVVQHLIPVASIIVVLVCTANVCPGIHHVFTGDNTGYKTAAGDAECPNFGLVCNAIGCSGSCQSCRTAQQAGQCQTTAENSTCGGGCQQSLHCFLHKKSAPSSYNINFIPFGQRNARF